MKVRNLLVIGMLCVAGLATAGSTTDSYNIKRALEAAQQQDWETSVSFLSQELKENPTNGYAYAYFAAVCDMMGGYDNAVFSFSKKALRYLPKSDRYMNSEMEGYLGEIYEKAKDTTRAMEHYRKAIAFDVTSPKFYGYLANLRDEQKDYEGLVEQADGMIHHIKGLDKEAVSYVIITTGLNGLKRYEETIQYADKGLAISDLSKGQQSVLHREKTKALMGMKRYDEALAEAMVTARLNTHRGMQLLEQIADSSDMQPVLDSIEAGFAADPSQYLWLAAASDIYARHNNHVQGTYQLLRSAKVQESSQLYCQAAEYAINYLGDAEMAEQLYRKALATDSTDVLTMGHLADLYHDLGRYEEALRTFDRVLTLDPEQKRFPVPYYLRGRVYRSMHNYSRAIEDYYRALASGSENTWAGIASLYKMMGDEAAAQKAIEQGLMTMQKDTTMDMLLVMGDTLAAKAKAPKMVTKESSANQQYNAACMYSRMEMPEEAMVALKKSLECGFRNFHHIAWDDDLDNIRDLPEFAALVNEYKAKALEEQAELKELMKNLN